MSDRNYDSRYVYAVGCTWHDSIHKVGNTGPSNMIINDREIKSVGLPCCPFCGSMLFEVPNKKDFFLGAEEHDKKYPGYLKYVMWTQGKCFSNTSEAISAFNSETGCNYTEESFGFNKEPK